MESSPFVKERNNNLNLACDFLDHCMASLLPVRYLRLNGKLSQRDINQPKGFKHVRTLSAGKRIPRLWRDRNQPLQQQPVPSVRDDPKGTNASLRGGKHRPCREDSWQSQTWVNSSESPSWVRGKGIFITLSAFSFLILLPCYQLPEYVLSISVLLLRHCVKCWGNRLNIAESLLMTDLTN